MRWVTMMTAHPLSRSSRILPKRRSVESRSSAAEDSSRIRILGSVSRARPMVIHCLMLSGKPPTRMSGSISTPASSCIREPAISYFSRDGRDFDQSPSAPTNRLSATEHSSRDENFLKHSGDPGAPRFERRSRRVAEKRELAAVRDLNARHHLGQGALAATVTADDRVDFAQTGAEAASVQRLGNAERLVHVHDGYGVARRTAVPRCDVGGAARWVTHYRRCAVQCPVLPPGRSRSYGSGLR